jgi:hypothetical protein
MTHPEELLADLVAGVLSAEDRTAVDTHLSSCDRCRREVALARQARGALASLEPAPAPVDVARRALDEAGDAAPLVPVATARKRPVAQMVAGAVAAAAVVALIAVALPHLDRSANSTAGVPAAAEGGSRTSPGGLSLEIQRGDYSPNSISVLAAARTNDVSSGFVGNTRAATPAPGGTETNDAAATAAVACLDRAFPGFAGTPVRLIRATFQETPAYIGVYLEGPGPGLPGGARSVRVASVDACTPLSFGQAKL